MPKINFSVENVQLIRLREEITQKVFCSEIHTIGDCRLLSEDIEVKSGMRLGINTIRRFWGLLDSVPPSKTTLDILALYCGYQNWSTFVATKAVQSIEIVVGDIVVQALITGQVCWKDYIGFRKKFRREKNLGEANFKIILVALQLKDDHFLMQVFDDKTLNYTLSVTNINPFFYSLALGSFVRNNPDLHAKLLPMWAKQKEGQRLFFEFYVDIDHLCGYYGDYLDTYFAHKKTPESTIFVASLHGLKSWFLNDATALIHHNNILRKTKDGASLHPYPIFRKYASLIRENEKDIVKIKSYVTAIKAYITNATKDRIDNVYMSAYVVLSALNEAGLYQDVLDIHKKLTNETTFEWFLNQLPTEQYKIHITMAYVGLGEYKKALKHFLSIKTERLLNKSLQIGWDKIIYLLTKARLQKEGILTGDYRQTTIEVKALIEKYRYWVYSRYCENIDLWLTPNNN
jgi:hypothetical protein